MKVLVHRGVFVFHEVQVRRVGVPIVRSDKQVAPRVEVDHNHNVWVVHEELLHGLSLRLREGSSAAILLITRVID